MNHKLRSAVFGVFIACITFFSVTAHALSVIRDTEVESVLTSYARKIFKTAGLNPNNAQIVLVNDPSINAFVAGGQTIFVHTGLITQSQSVDDIIFVLSHETGHIVGGHVVRGIGAYGQARTTALISTILGGLVAVAGRPDAGMAVMMGGSTSAVGMFTAYRQTEESSADRTAVDIMQKMHYSMRGFENTMKLIQAQERISSSDDFSYLRTHPLTRERINALERFTKNAPAVRDDVRYDLIRAKLIGFLYEPAQTRSLYQNDTSLAGDYARAIAMYRAHQFEQAQQMIDNLIRKKSDYPYFYELKGQFYLETGNLNNAIDNYQKAINLMPNAPLMRLSMAQALLERRQTGDAARAIPHLKSVLAKENDTPLAWQLLATAYDLTSKQAEIPYAMAEYYRTIGDLKSAKRMAKKALDTLPKNTPAYQHARDIMALPEEKGAYY